MNKFILFSKQPILQNTEMDLQLSDLGYAIFPFLKEEDIIALTSYYFDIQEKTPEQFYSSTHADDFIFRKRTSNFLKKIIKPLLPNVLSNYKLLGGSFVAKPANGRKIRLYAIF